mmetsp:Transcript_23053/g.72562  ORF Transcript_23053/g.72562 Transcript_23053/m.72562 type:complete len:477 (+) Transcript_23053:74-1504(+)
MAAPDSAASDLNVPLLQTPRVWAAARKAVAGLAETSQSLGRHFRRDVPVALTLLAIASGGLCLLAWGSSPARMLARGSYQGALVTAGAPAGAAATAVTSPAGSPSSPPPLFRIAALSLHEAGLQHGRLARERIRGWLATADMRRLLGYVATPEGAQAFAQLKRDNAAEFPELVEELRGIAEGAGVSLDEVWCMNLVNEFSNLLAQRAAGAAPAQDCSDLFAVAPGGYSAGFAQGHNEDWDNAVKPFLYFISYTLGGDATGGSAGGRGLGSCAGLTYPGHIIGSPPAWNRHGLYATQNHLTPRRSRSSGLALAFVKRRALCESRGLDDFVTALTVSGWSTGASVNAVDLAGRMANIELWEDRHSVLEVTKAMGNYSHFNEYKHLRTGNGLPVDDPGSFRRDPRQPRVDALPSVRSDRDIAAVLSDAQVFVPAATVATLVLNGSTGVLKFWCCGVPAASSEPIYSWNLSSFFVGQEAP